MSKTGSAQFNRLWFLFFLAILSVLHCNPRPADANPEDHSMPASGGPGSPENGTTLQRVRASESSIARKHRGKLHLFLLAGQSNMSGRGRLARLSPADRKKDPSIYVFGNDYRWALASEPIDASDGQLDSVSEDPGAGVSPAMAFARELKKSHPEVSIGLIPCAMGATTMFEWERRPGRDSLYGSCLERARLASSMGELKAILFFQGEWDALGNDHARLLAHNRSAPQKRPGNRIHYSSESNSLPAGLSEQDLRQRGLEVWPFSHKELYYDSQDNVDRESDRKPRGLHLTLRLKGSKGYNRSEPALWAYLFADYVDNMRFDLQRPDLPVVFAQIGSQKRPEVYLHWDTVKKAQEAVNLQQVEMIKTEDLALLDSVHFNTASYIEIGKRFARAYLHMIGE